MGLLLSVLVVCVGVLEVLACVRHFQDGYLPLWTPHCAVTSGYTSSYERWRKKPSDSCEFRSFDEVCGEVNHTANQTSENCLESSSNIRNGFAGKQIEKTSENNYPSTDCCYQHPKSDSRTGFAPSIDDHTEEACDYRNVSDISASSLVCDEGERKVVDKNVTNAVSSQRIPHAEYDTKCHERFAAEFPSHSRSEIHTVSIGTQYEVLDSGVQIENAVSLPYSLREEPFVNDVTEKDYISAKKRDVEDKVPSLDTGDELRTSYQRNYEDVHDDILGGKQPTQHDIFGPKAEAEIQSSCLHNERVCAGGKQDHQVLILEDEPSVPVLDCITSTFSGRIEERDQIPSTEIKSQSLSSDFTVDKPFSAGLELERQIPPPGHEINVPSSVLLTQEGKSDFGVSAGEPPVAIAEEPDTQPEGKILCFQNESAVPASPNCEHRFHVPSSETEETSVTPVEGNTEHNVPISYDGIESELAGTVYKEPACSLEVTDALKEIYGLNVYAESQTSLSVENIGEQLETDTHKGIEPTNSHRSATSATESTSSIHQGSEIVKQNNLENVCEAHSLNEENVGLEEDGTGTQHEVSDPRIGPGPSSSDFENEKDISITSKDSKQDVSESRLDSQTILSDTGIPLEEGSLRDSGFSGSNELAQPSICEGSSDVQTSSLTSLTPLTMDTSIQLSVSSPLTIDTSLETSASVSPLPADRQTSQSPPKVPSTPKKSKADISWPTFFPGTPVIKRPSVSFATPEAVFTSEDQDVLRQYAEEAPIDLSYDNSTETESETAYASSGEEKELESTGTPERSDSFEDEPDPVIYRERSPSNIVAGNDFSRKELKLHRRRSYKQKRYSSAIEIRTRDEETEDRSFSENNPGLTRATSVTEPKKRYKRPAKSSSFEDVMLRDIKGEPCLTATTEEISDVSFPDGRETEREETRQQEPKNFEEVSGETKEGRDVSDCLSVPTERNEPKHDKSKQQVKEEEVERKEAAKGQKEEVRGGKEEEEEYSVSEEQSSSQQKSPPKEAFWVSSEDGIH
ncbi:hypothetical protein B7P43_G13127 [Cryptotermes secundus]|uniref:Uncharacterized protein n=1 Tax=Cryptotermes secundus TaxID=105785 RepID=A0A2J7QVR1_9NEOP|nr:hypothetical protein B7P43_G13127 [Cryptotermes secundus]